MSIRTGILSDKHVLKHCSIYSPIPMKIADKLLHQDLNVHKESPFTTKKLKYHNAISRPTSFNTLANSLTRIGGNDLRIREHLIKSFVQEINGNGSEYSNGNGNGNGGYDSNGNGTASTASDEINFVSPVHDNIPYEPFSMGTHRGFETPVQSPVSSGNAPSPSTGPMSDYMLPNLPQGYSRERLAMERMGHTYPTPIRQDRIRLQEEFARHPRTHEMFERAGRYRLSIDRQSGYLGDTDFDATWPDLQDDNQRQIL